MPLVPALFALGLAFQARPAPAPPTAPPAVSTDGLTEAYFLFLQGRDLEDRNDIAGAVADFRRAAELCPSAADIQAELALALGRHGDSAEALKAADAALAIDRDNRAAHRVRGLLKADLVASTQDPTRVMNLANDAIADLEVVVADRLVDRTAELTLGRLYVQTKQYDKGIETLKLFLLDRPAYPEALLLLAEAYEQTQQFAQAADAVEEVASQRPDQMRLWPRLGDLRERAGQWADAAEVWAHLAEANPTNLGYRSRQAGALVNAGNLAAGRDVLTKLTEQAPGEINLWYLLAQVDRRAGDAARAEADAKRILAIDPADSRGPIALAGARAVRGDYAGVVAILDPLVRAGKAEDVSTGMFARMASELSAALRQTGQENRAVSVLEEARRRDTDNVELLFDLAAEYDRAKRLDDAERAFRELIAQSPGHAEALNYLGYMLADRGTKLDEAVGLISRALAIEPDNPSFLDSLGWAYVKQDKLVEARDPLQRAAAALPTSSVIQDHLGELCFKLKLYREAAEAWTRALAGDRNGIDVDAVTKARDRARALADR
jgi:tetratricopeptide (TPR) repeat protein